MYTCKTTIYNRTILVKNMRDFLTYRKKKFHIISYIEDIYFFEVNIKFIYFIECVENIRIFTSAQQLDQLANLHFHYTSVPRYTHMTCGMEVQRNTDGDTPSTQQCFQLTRYRRKGSYRFKTAFPEPISSRKGAYSLKTRHWERREFKYVLISEYLRCK